MKPLLRSCDWRQGHTNPAYALIMRSFCAFVLTLAAAFAGADTKYYVTYVGSVKLGYMKYDQRPDHLKGQTVVRLDSHSVMLVPADNSVTNVVSDSTSWVDAGGTPILVKSVTRSGGRTQTSEAVYGAGTVDVYLNSEGVKTHKTVSIPNGSLLDDPMMVAKVTHPKPGSTIGLWSLDANTFTFKKFNVKFDGDTTATVQGKKLPANLFEISMQGLILKVFVDANGDLVKLEGPMGVEVRPEPKQVALAAMDKPAAIDLEALSSLKTDKKIADADNASEVKLRISGVSEFRFESDASQTAAKDTDDWVIDIHPVHFDPQHEVPIDGLAKGQEEWLKATTYIPATKQEFKDLAIKLAPADSGVIAGTDDIVEGLHKLLKYTDGIDVMRDASEILKTKEGVCRDFAVLAATVLRARGIPAKIVTGLVYDDGAFYGHAWNEVWDGRQWVPVDSTIGTVTLAALYIEIASGNAEEVYSMTYPMGAKISVLSVKR